MNAQDPLAQLQPLRTPEPVSWWPPAPGWWLLAALLLGLAGWAGWRYWRHYRRNAYRRLALRKLARITQDYAGHQDIGRLLGELNSLLKSVALQVWPRRDIAALNGDRWLQFLRRHAGKATPALPVSLASSAYSPKPQEPEPEQLLLAVEAWLQQHRSAP
ncbi:DUF4381 domain-containing protein [Kineobactrum salinum]|uniref:DUF4381 domain-containing protein n=1 Tax=Kineobactrum salinum TaxID=2708301 RepID=A0A6C0U4Z4_9GAMM|nr:DUF4381 domain-containing protein [Kineobactrum salinum]QIB67232.1 DUF4381 domain-containing protein [Kineobactrum salinum]